MNYWLGITKLNVTNRKLIIQSDDGFNIVIELADGEVFRYNKCINTQELKTNNIKISKVAGTNQYKGISGFAQFISSLAILIKKHITTHEIQRENLNTLFDNIFNIVKAMLN